MKHRLIEDFATVLVAHKLFERFPGLRVAYIENGADWVPRCLHSLHMLGGQNPDCSPRIRSTSSLSIAGWRPSSRTASKTQPVHAS